MKKIIFLIICPILFVSCNINNFEKKARKQLDKTMKELAKNPNSYEIRNEKTVFINDSICIIHFIGSGQNGFGGTSSSNCEYVYYTVKSTTKGLETYEMLVDLDKKKNKSILEEAKEEYKSKSWVKFDTFKGLDEKDIKAQIIYSVAVVNGIFSARIVNEKKQSEDIDNW